MKRFNTGCLWANYSIMLTAALALTACVTINIYFPAAAAEKAADKIIDEVWQLDPNKPASTPSSQPSPTDTPTK